MKPNVIRECSTEEFWDAMCRPDFERVSLWRGRVLDGYLVCAVPPERVPGFIAAKIDGIADDLRLDELRSPSLLRRAGAWVAMKMAMPKARKT